MRQCVHICVDIYIGTCLIAENQQVLLDTGATSCSHMDVQLLTPHMDDIKDHLRHTTQSLRVANGQTSSASFLVHNVSVVLKTTNEESYIFYGMTVLASELANPLIIGLPHIVTSFLPILVSQLQKARKILLTPQPRVFMVENHELSDVCETADVDQMHEDILRTNNPHLISFLTKEKLEDIVEAYKNKDNHSPIENDDSEIIPEEEQYSDKGIYDEFLLNRDFENNKAIYLEKVKHLFDDNKEIPPDLIDRFVSLLSTLGIDVHVPHDDNWTGIVDHNGNPYIIDFTFADNMPKSHYVRARNVNPKIHDPVREAVMKLARTIWEAFHKARIVHALSIASKKTEPFFRIAVDFKFANTYTQSIHAYIPDFRKALVRLSQYSVFIDTDMKASFRQFRLSEETSNTLAIITMWGVFRSKFMMEGSKCSSAVLQHKMNAIFGDYEFIVQIFDNFVVCGKNGHDLFDNYVTFLQVCKKHNIFINFDKTFVYLKTITFFGYEASCNGYTIEPKKKHQLTTLPFPTTLKMLQHALGITVYFIPFVPNYKILAIPLTEMLQKNFNWDQSTWTQDYRQHWLTLLNACAEAWGYSITLTTPH